MNYARKLTRSNTEFFIELIRPIPNLAR